MSYEKKSKEDTWRPEELQESLKNAFDSSAHKSKHSKGSRQTKDKRRKEGDEDIRVREGDERGSHSKKSLGRHLDDSDVVKKAVNDRSKVEDAENMEGKKRSRKDASGRKERKIKEGDERETKGGSEKDPRHQGNLEEKQERRRSKHRESDKKERSHQEIDENQTWEVEERKTKRESEKNSRHQDNSEEKRERRRSKHRESNKERSHQEIEENVDEERLDRRSERRERARKEAQKDSRRREDSEEKRERRRSKHREIEKKVRSRQEEEDSKVDRQDQKHDWRERLDEELPRDSSGGEKEHRRSRHKESKREERHQQEDSESRQDLPLNGDKGDGQLSLNTAVPSQSDEYESDFEEYEEDFEDGSGQSEAEEQVDTSEVEALRMAMVKENEAMYRQTKGSANTSRSSSATSKSTARSRQTFINFTAAKQRQINNKTSLRMKRRGHELMNLIELDVTSCSLFEMPPVKVYELYIKTYGRSDTKQAFVQCHDDVLDRDIQTEPIETRDVVVQHPFEGASVINVSNDVNNSIIKSNPVRLSAFLEKASQVMNALLEETLSHAGTHGQLQASKHSILFSEGCSIPNSDFPFLEGRCVTCTQFHPHQANLLLTVHSRSKLNGSNSSVGDILCVWNTNNLSQPQRILRSKSQVRSCCFSPVKSTLAFAGTVDGAILVWDLREPLSMHCHIGDGEVKWPLRVPTFSTYGANNDETHHSAIVRIQPVVSAGDNVRTSTNKNDEMNGLSFQLASLDEQGVIHFWVVIDLEVSDIAGSETDIGLVPGGKVKLLRSSTIILESPSRNLSQSIQAKDMKLSTTDPNQFYVATDSGCILHGTRHGDRVSPKCYRKQNDALDDVTQLDISPFGLPCFLASSSDGSVYLYCMNFESPLITWSNSTGGMPIVCIAWSRSRPSVFYVVDVTSKIYVWELLKSSGGPVKTEQFTNTRLITMELSCDHSVTSKTQGKAPTMVIADDKGGFDVHILNQHFSVADGDEMEEMVVFLDSLK